MMKKFLFACLAIAAPLASADATIVKVDFESQRGSPDNEVLGSFSYDTDLAPSFTDSIPGVLAVATYEIGTFTWSVAGRAVTGPVKIDIGDLEGQDVLYAYIPLSDDQNVNFILDWPATKFDGVKLPGDLSGGTAVVGLFGALGPVSPATYTVTYSNAAVPEPAVWGLMISGFGLAGSAMRRRETRSTVTFA